MKLLLKVYKYIRPKTRRELEEEYLSKAVDMVDLESRMKILERPPENPNLRGWI